MLDGSIHGEPLLRRLLAGDDDIDDEIGLVSIAHEQIFELGVGDARQHRRVGDLVAIQMQNRQHRAVATRIKKLVGMPRRGQRRFAVAHAATRDEVGVVEYRAIRMQQRISKFAAFVDRAGRLGRDMAGEPPGNENCRNSRCMPASSAVISGYTLLYVPSRYVFATRP